jgi:hypothetical protein
VWPKAQWLWQHFPPHSRQVVFTLSALLGLHERGGLTEPSYGHVHVSLWHAFPWHGFAALASVDTTQTAPPACATPPEPAQVSVTTSPAPLLTSKQIQAVKARSLAQSSRVARAVRHAALRLHAAACRTAGGSSSSSTMAFIHPAAIMGASEVSLMQWRLNASVSPQAGALQSMLTGAGVRAGRGCVCQLPCLQARSAAAPCC